MLVLFSCQNVPTYPSGQDDLIEMESVWQYLKAYSIHQDECASGSGTSCVKKLRDSPFFYKTPEEMMLGLDDTLRETVYTKYDLSAEKCASASIGSGLSEDRLVKLYQVTSSTALIRISRFDTDVTYSQFCDIINKLDSSFTKMKESDPSYTFPIKNYIIDVCQNPGGDLDELDSILELFLPENTPYILARERAYDTISKQYTTIDYRALKTKRPASPILTGKKVVVLMDSGSASAAEILASGLKDGCGAILAGDTTYGKAIGQIKLPRRGRKWLQITFLQLKGISAGRYQNVGLVPDVTIPKLNIYKLNDNSLLEVVRLVEPDVRSSDLTMTPSLRKTREPLLPEGYKIRDVQIGL